ncbi:lipase 1-like [Battus philenor]|uniref:lipase 1-like n=1 Tax=Battus philenor TaxID=42288 RepID=UPI0035CED3C0
MEFKILFIVLFFVFEYYKAELSEDGKLNFLQLAQKYGHSAIEYHVITEDGYILKLFRIPGAVGIPVLLMHGILDSSDTWLIRGNGSLCITLARQGYDVWIANNRGNRYGRNHLYLDPNSNDGFWDFSFHEIGYFDLPAIIDTVLLISNASKVNAIGHSQGNTVFYVLGSTRPEYNAKVNVIIALAPVAFLNNIPHPLKDIIDISSALVDVAQILNIHEVLGDKSISRATLRKFCSKKFVGYKVCVLGFLFPLSGYDEDELEKNYTPTFFGHFPAGTSLKSLQHYAQVSLRRKFAAFDYGEENYAVYQSPVPPEYDLSAVTMKIVLFVGANDKISTVEDVAILRQKLPNDTQYLLLPRRKMNHVDFISGRHMGDYLFSYIFDVLTENGGKE